MVLRNSEIKGDTQIVVVHAICMYVIIREKKGARSSEQQKNATGIPYRDHSA